ncbi:putative pre-mRNA-splicing factor 38 [Iris pallida]|uniref:Pre-mRNA-splicing factor 38 n=1 Tax=Iris pallida TaxID=29817 RepID=A0AAX6E0Q9_IRIPA|nr:putative pre-mRNA-splicing factor 38 [Iris pallida]
MCITGAILEAGVGMVETDRDWDCEDGQRDVTVAVLDLVPRRGRQKEKTSDGTDHPDTERLRRPTGFVLL